MTVHEQETRLASDTEAWLDQLDPAATIALDASAHREVIAANTAVADADARLARAVAEARAAGYSWAMIGASLGTTRQAAQQRFKH